MNFKTLCYLLAITFVSSQEQQEDVALNGYKPNKCPKPDDTCTSGYKTFKASDPNAPPCWTKTYNGYKCTSKYGNKCSGYGAIDISKCNYKPPNPCPNPSDRCKDSYGKIYSLGQYDAPKCWSRNSYDRYWKCRNPGYGGKCSNGEVDINNCVRPRAI